MTSPAPKKKKWIRGRGKVDRPGRGSTGKHWPADSPMSNTFLQNGEKESRETKNTIKRYQRKKVIKHQGKEE